jgi:hypothetical protein
MNDDLDLQRLAEIPDPFAQAGQSPLRQLSPDRAIQSPARSRVLALRALALAAMVLYDVAWPVLVERRPDLRSVPPLELALGLVIPLASAALAATAFGRQGNRGLGEPTARLLMLVIASLALFAAGTLIFAPENAAGGRFWRQAAGCLLVTAVLAAGPLALGALAFRRAFAAASVGRSAALGVAIGALAAATMSIACSNSSAGHVLVGHGAIMLLAGAVGALLGRRILQA